MNNDFHAAKGAMIDVIDGLTDAQRDIVSVNKYQVKQLRLMGKRLSEPRWKMQLKYSTRVGAKCLSGQDAIIDNFEKTKRQNMAL